jgi:selenocysteine lyase/cysteine desulfurase
MIPNQKDLFNIPPDVTYLNCAYMAPQLKSISDIGIKNLRKKEQPWNIEVGDFFDPPEKLKSLFAQIIHAQSEQIALIPSVSYGIETAVKNIPVTRGAEIVVLAEQFPSNIYPWLEAAKAKGAQMVIVTRPEEGGWTHAILETINPATAVVALPQAHWTDGSFIDLVQIRKRCDEIGAALVIDATQSVGVTSSL